jgi:hypothetical protein
VDGYSVPKSRRYCQLATGVCSAIKSADCTGKEGSQTHPGSAQYVLNSQISTPFLILCTAELDDLRTEKSKEHYHEKATQFVNQGDQATSDAGQAANSLLSFLTRGMCGR